jgi:hypothetical protein
MLILTLLCAAAFADSFIWLEGEDADSHNFSHHSWYGDGVNKHLLSPGLPELIDGDWLVNYNWSDAGPKSASWYIDAEDPGEYALWLRVAVPLTQGWVAIDGSDSVDLQLDSHTRERINLTQPELDHRMLGWVYAGQWDLTEGLHTVTFGLEPHAAWGGDLNCGGIDALVLVDFDWAPSGAEQPDLSGDAPEADAWFSFHPSDPPADWSTSVSAASPDTPAGGRGRIRREGARFVDDAGQPIKLWGINADLPVTEDLMEQQAQLYAHMGINLVRNHTVQSMINGSDGIDADALDQYDLWFSILREAGVYVQWSIFYPHRIQESDGYALYDDLNSGSTSGLVTVFPELQALEWAYLEPLLAHTNPYTGLTYAEDPALAIIEMRNEDSVFWHAPLNGISDGTYSAHAAALQADWADWLADKYTDDATLADAWGDGMRGSDGLDNPAMGIYGAWEMEADGPWSGIEEAARMGDWIAFLAQRQRDGYLNRISLLRADAGYEGVIISTAWKAGGGSAVLANLWTDDAADAIDRHGYFGGGTLDSWWQLGPGPIANGSMLTEPGQGVFDFADLQIEDKPFLLSEWTSSPPNQQKLEAVPMYAFYGMGLYGWDASLHFAGGSAWFDGGWPDWSQYGGQTPHHLGQFQAVSRAVHEGHLQEGSPSAVLRYTEDDIFNGIDPRPERDPWLGAVGPQQVSFEGGSTEIVDVADYTDGDFIQSTTGELLWNTAGYFLVHTDKTQGVVGLAGSQTIELPDVTVELQTEFVSLLFTSLDGEPLSGSQSILVTALARDQQTSATYSEDGTELVTLGGPPLLLEPVQATLTFEGEEITEVRTLNAYGVPTGTVDDVEGATVRIDGRWATAWYQVVRGPLTDSGDPDEDPDTATDPDAVGDVGTEESEDKSGCGCAAVSGTSPLLWLLSLAIAARRRT